MFCIYCGKPLGDDDAFCTNCGQKTNVATVTGDEAEDPREVVESPETTILTPETPPADEDSPAYAVSDANEDFPAYAVPDAGGPQGQTPEAKAKPRKRRWPFVAGGAVLILAAALFAVFVLNPFGIDLDIDWPAAPSEDEAVSAPSENMPGEQAEAERFLAEKLSLLEEHKANEAFSEYFDVADEMEKSILQVLESETGDEAYPAEIIALSEEYLEKLDASTEENGRDVLSALYEEEAYDAMVRFYSSTMIREDNRDDMVDMMFRAFAETGDFVRAERVVRELLYPFTDEALAKTLEYQELLTEEYAEREPSWNELAGAAYDRVMPFENGMAKVANNVGTAENKQYKWGIVDSDGKEVVSPIYDTIGGFLEGRAAVQNAGMWGFIDESGALVIDMQYEDLKDVQDPVLYAYAVRDPERVLRGFYEGFAPVKKNGKWGYIDPSGNALGQGFVYQDVWYFSEGCATVETDGKYGLLDNTGRYIIEPDTYGQDGINFDVVRPLYEGLAGVNWNGRKDRGVINREGNLVAWFDPQSIDLVQDYREGLASVRNHVNGTPKWGFIDRNGEIAIPVQYDSVSVFIDGVSRVSNNGKIGLINGNGDVILPIAYDEIGEFHDDIAYVRKDNKIGFVRRNGELLRDPIYDSVSNFSDGLACVCFRGKWGAIDSNGNTVLTPAFEGMKAYSGGVAPAKMNGKWGYVDASGYFVIPPQFEKANSFSEGFAAVSEGDKYVFIALKEVSNNLDGEVVDELGNPVEVASVKVYTPDDLRMRDALFSTMTSGDGTFKIVMPEGEFKIVVSKEDCLDGVSYEEIGKEAKSYAARIILIEDPGRARTSEAEINVGDALTGRGVDSARVSFRRGFNNKTGARVRSESGETIETATDSDGNFTAVLPYGLYTAEVISEGYTTIYINFPVGKESETAGRRIMSRAMTEALPPGETRITLEWGEHPQDLDAHLIGPVSGSYGSFHIYYPVKGSRIEDSMLDKDDVEGNGFETTTIYTMHDGVYRFSVFDFTNQDDYYSSAMSHSGARVSVYRGDECVAVFDIPANKQGNLWEVFQIEGNTIQPINNVTAHHDVSFYTY